MNTSVRQVYLYINFLAILFALIVVSCNRTKQLPTITPITIEANRMLTNTESPSVTPQPSESPSPKLTSTPVPSLTSTSMPVIVFTLQDGISLSYGYAEAAAWNSVDNLLVIASTAGLHIYDAISYQERYSIRYAGMSKEGQMDIELKPEEIAISPDGQFIAVVGVGGFQLLSVNGTIITYHIAQHAKSVTFSQDNTSVAFYITSCASTCVSVIELISTKDGKQIRQFRKDDSEYGYVLSEITGLSFSPDGRQIVTVNAKNSLDIWDVATGKYLYSLSEGFTNPVNIAFSPDGKIFISISDSGIVNLWDINNKQLIKSFQVPAGRSNQIFFYPEGQKALIGGVDTPYKVLDIHSGKIIETLGLGTAEIFNFSPDRRFALVRCGSSVCLHETFSGQQAHVFEGYLGFQEIVRFDQSGQTLAVITWNEKDSSDLTIRFWDTVGKYWRQSFVMPYGEAPSMAFSDDGKLFAATSDVEQPIFIWDIETGEKIHEFTIDSQPRYPDDITCLGFRPYSDILIIGNGTGIYTWDMAHETLQHIIEKQGEQITNLDFSDDGETLTIISRDYGGTEPHVEVWSFLDKGIVNTFDPRPLQFGDWSAYDLYERTLARITVEWHVNSSRTSALELWDIDSGKLLQSSLGPEWYALNVALSADGKLLAAHGFRKLTIWDIETLQPIAHLTDYNLQDIAFSPTGNVLAIIKYDHTITLLDITQLSQIK